MLLISKTDPVLPLSLILQYDHFFPLNESSSVEGKLKGGTELLLSPRAKRFDVDTLRKLHSRRREVETGITCSVPFTSQ